MIGKDIAKFHCGYWPLFLKASGFDYPGKVLVHSHWTMGGVKMSKSLGNVIDPFSLYKKYAPDAVRSYIVSNGPLFKDADFEENDLIKNYNEFVLNSYVNLLYRSKSAKFEQLNYQKG